VAEIQGKTASAEEGRVALALDKLKHQYIFQYQVFTITGVKGSFVLDFLVLTTVPFSTPLEVFGEYWHSANITREDQLRLERIEFELGPNINETQIVWGSEAQTQEDADEVVRRKVGRA
jgi:hypothetical protein